MISKIPDPSPSGMSNMSSETNAPENWYVATQIFRCLVDGQQGNPYRTTAAERRLPAVIRKVLVLRTVSPEAAYEKALGIGRSGACEYIDANGVLCVWEYAGLEDLELLNTREIGDGCVVWSRVAFGLPASDFISDVEELSVHWPDRGWLNRKPEQYWPKPSG